MRRLIVTIGALGLLGGCVVHERTPRYGYHYAPGYGPRHEWRAEERHERHEAHEHEWR
jgi:hypothetical protein